MRLNTIFSPIPNKVKVLKHSDFTPNIVANRINVLFCVCIQAYFVNLTNCFIENCKGS